MYKKTILRINALQWAALVACFGFCGAAHSNCGVGQSLAKTDLGTNVDSQTTTKHPDSRAGEAETTSRLQDDDDAKGNSPQSSLQNAATPELPTLDDVIRNPRDPAQDSYSEPEPKEEIQTINIPETWKRLSEGHEVWVDFKNKTVIAAGHICLQAGPLEVFICPRGTKEHEAVISVNALSSEIHAALLAIGSEPGKPVQWQEKYRPASGPVIKIDVMWQAGEKIARRNGQEMVRNVKTGKAMSHEWVFGGSVTYTDEESGETYYYGDSGELVCLSNFSTATMDVPVKSSDANEGLLFEANTANIPPVNTKVYVVFKPVVAAPASVQKSTIFQIRLDPTVSSKPITGRMLVFLSKRSRAPINGPAWFGTEPFFGIDVEDMKPGDTITVDDSADWFPSPLSKIKLGEYNVQAILDHDFYYANHATGPGNFYSTNKKLKIDGSPIELNLNNVVNAPEYRESNSVKFVEIKSNLLGKFHDRDVIERAMVVLPQSYHKSPNRRYPVYYVITGFGGTLQQLQPRGAIAQNQPDENAAEFIHVHLTGQCKWGHHVYANSATNGPRGDALVQELIPEIDQRFRTLAESTARFVGGHSSGGWSSLWLQVTYPDMFGGVWSTAPDPVDFRDWQGTDLYSESANVYYDTDGQKKPLARAGNRVMAYYHDFTKMDDVLGRGGQIRSFDAVFSPTKPNGQPAHCWNRETGAVDRDVFEHWQKYDISLILQNNWDRLAPLLNSKLHVYMGDQDTFYLDGAVEMLGEKLTKLGSDAIIEIFAGKDHNNLLSHSLRKRIHREMSAQFWKNHPRVNRAAQGINR